MRTQPPNDNSSTRGPAKMSKVVFVGNVPYNMGEDQLIDVFKSVGQVVGFRLVFERETGKAKGYGFCEFSDHETALSAVRNLNNIDVGGRPLRIDLADSDPFLEGKTTVRGEILDGGFPGPSEPRSSWRATSVRADPEAFLAHLPPGKPVHSSMSVLDGITATLASIPPHQLLEVLAQMKAFIITHPEQARILLTKQPQLSYALFQALLLHKIVPNEVLFRMRDASSQRGMSDAKRPAPLLSQVPPPMPQQPPLGPPRGPAGGPPPLMHHQPPPYHYPLQQHGVPAYPPPMPTPPPSAMYAPPPLQQQPGPPLAPSYYRMPAPPPPSHPPVAPAAQHHQQQQQGAPSANITDVQRDMIMQVLSLSQETINSLPPEQKATIQQLRSQFMAAAP